MPRQSLRNIREAEAALLPYVPLVAQLTGKDTTLERIEPLMAHLGNPQDRLRTVHIAGTSGKTSTAYYIAALLQAVVKPAGGVIGLAVSPHVDSVTERVQIGGKPLSEQAFCAHLSKFLEIIESFKPKPSYFELLYAFALWVFEQSGVQYAVVETGMGGLYDATNVAGRADKVCVITDIGFDHMHILGHTLPEITHQKIGIVHEHNTVIMYEQAAEVMSVIESWVRDKQAKLFLATESAEHALLGDTIAAKLPQYQQRNWLLAHRVYQYLLERDHLSNLTRQVLLQTQAIQVPGRMDISHIGDKTVIMDGAHNAQKMLAFTESFRQLYPNVKPAIMIALKDGKDYQDVVPLLASLASRVLVTTFETSQDLPVRSMDPELLMQTFRAAGQEAEYIADHRLALEALLKYPEKICIITGSLYLLSQIRKLSA